MGDADVAGREIEGACSPPSWSANPAEVAATLDAFYEEDDEEVIAFARSICLGCDARERCLDIAMSTNEKFGMWGGRTPAERQRLRRTGIDPYTSPEEEANHE